MDPTNWWGPNPEAVIGMLHAAGFARVEMVTPDSNAYRAARSARRAAKYARKWARDRARPPEHPAQGRGVFPAFR
jgi:hypothetical protein